MAEVLEQFEHGAPVLDTSHRTLRSRQRLQALGALFFSMAISTPQVKVPREGEFNAAL